MSETKESVPLSGKKQEEQLPPPEQCYSNLEEGISANTPNFKKIVTEGIEYALETGKEYVVQIGLKEREDLFREGKDPTTTHYAILHKGEEVQENLSQDAIMLSRPLREASLTNNSRNIISVDINDIAYIKLMKSQQ
jgi:hypothetical protein